MALRAARGFVDGLAIERFHRVSPDGRNVAGKLAKAAQTRAVDRHNFHRICV